jgi:hypothetical protein
MVRRNGHHLHCLLSAWNVSDILLSRQLYRCRRASGYFRWTSCMAMQRYSGFRSRRQFSTYRTAGAPESRSTPSSGLNSSRSTPLGTRNVRLMEDQIGTSSRRIQINASTAGDRSQIAFMLTPLATLEIGSPCIHMTFGILS